MATSDKWSEHDIGDQSGRVAVVTGANSGIGFETARALAQRGADVILACRNPDRAADARGRIEALSPAGSVHVLLVDLGDLDSVAGACTEFRERFGRLDLLINNAGAILMDEGTTAQGYETHFGVNHLGHFALTGGLLPTILATDGSRIVTVSSMGHRAGRIDVDSFRGMPSTSRCGPTARASWPTCCSPQSSSVGSSEPEAPPSPSQHIPGAPGLQPATAKQAP